MGKKRVRVTSEENSEPKKKKTSEPAKENETDLKGTQVKSVLKSKKEQLKKSGKVRKQANITGALNLYNTCTSVAGGSILPITVDDCVVFDSFSKLCELGKSEWKTWLSDASKCTLIIYSSTPLGNKDKSLSCYYKRMSKMLQNESTIADSECGNRAKEMISLVSKWVAPDAQILTRKREIVIVDMTPKKGIKEAEDNTPPPIISIDEFPMQQGSKPSSYYADALAYIDEQLESCLDKAGVDKHSRLERMRKLERHRTAILEAIDALLDFEMTIIQRDSKQQDKKNTAQIVRSKDEEMELVGSDDEEKSNDFDIESMIQQEIREHDKQFLEASEVHEPVDHKPDTWQPSFTPIVEVDDIEPEAQSGVIGAGIRDLLKSHTPEAKVTERIGLSGFIPMNEFDARITPISPAVVHKAVDITNADIPWLSGKNSKASSLTMKSTLRLHNEILLLARLLAETPAEKQSREDAVNLITSVCTELWPDSSVNPFGSYANDLCIPDSDVDVVLFDVPKNAIYLLSRTLKSRNLVQEMEVIDSARIPIIKLRLKMCPYQIDISFNEPGGPATGFMIRKLVKEMPVLKPLVLVIKYFLHQRNINETYRGGIGSHLCLCMVVSVIQQIRKQLTASKDLESDRVEELEDLGTIMIRFFDLYGKKFNYASVTISLRNGGSYMPKPRRFLQQGRPGMLSIENPENPDNDLGMSSYNIPKIRKAFAHAHRRLMDHLSRGVSDNRSVTSILSSIISPNDKSLISRV